MLGGRIERHAWKSAAHCGGAKNLAKLTAADLVAFLVGHRVLFIRL
jgi:hypothetical protein